MARGINKLSDAEVRKKAWKPGLYADGGGLYLQVSPTGSKSWLFRYMRDRKAKKMGLGSLLNVPLATARKKAEAARYQLGVDRDPLDDKRAQKAAAKQETQAAVIQGITFRACAEAYINAHRASWKNAKHQEQWAATLDTYVYPKFGDLPVASIGVAEVMSALEPIWAEKPETAARVRGRIEAILDWAKAREYRAGENPARWRGHLSNLLPARSKIAKVKHFAALPYVEIGAFIDRVRCMEGTSARALEFAILTATRTNETLGARWPEINVKERVWIIPPERMKAGQEHRVPLSDRALEILASLPREKGSDFVFLGAKPGKPLSNTAMLMTMRRMERGDLTTHGFRSTFRDWVAERTSYPREVADMALAHTISDKVDAAYRRGDLFDKRRRLMDEWSRYCLSAPAGEVVSIRGAAHG